MLTTTTNNNKNNNSSTTVIRSTIDANNQQPTNNRATTTRTTIHQAALASFDLPVRNSSPILLRSSQNWARGKYFVHRSALFFVVCILITLRMRLLCSAVYINQIAGTWGPWLSTNIPCAMAPKCALQRHCSQGRTRKRTHGFWSSRVNSLHTRNYFTYINPRE